MIKKMIEYGQSCSLFLGDGTKKSEVLLGFFQHPLLIKNFITLSV